MYRIKLIINAALHEPGGASPAFYVLMSGMAFGLGVLIVWRTAQRLVTDGVTIHYGSLALLLPVAVASFIPPLYWVSWFGLGGAGIPQLLSEHSMQLLLNVASGAFLIQALRRSS